MAKAGRSRAVEVLRGAKVPLDAAVGALRSRVGRGARRQIAVKDAKIAALRRELGRTPGVGGTPVFFVVGQQKSGTTWLMRMLDAHPEILCRGEGRFFGREWRQESVKETDAKRPPSSLYNAVLDAEYLRLWIERSVWSRDDDPDEHVDNLLRMAVDYFLMAELSKTGKRLVGDKSPLLTPDTVGEISAVYPEAKVIHIIRDGRDAVVSAVHHSWNFGGKKSARASARREAYLNSPTERRESVFAKNSLGRMAAEWAARVGRTVKDGPKLLGDNYAEVRYEDLLERPEEEVARLLAFLGADSGAEAVKRCVGAGSFERLSKGRKRGEEDVTSFFRKGVAGDWKNAFTERDKEVFKEEAGELLVQLGYEGDDGW
ncbi:MAG: sulfotransferase [Rubrobacteraceae bacterium]|nr:sulfotransferase [Rubrobacteraceae bacterium]